MVTVARGNAMPVCWSVIFPEMESCADANTGSSKAHNAVSKFFKMIIIN
jgi:hypothetical protein